MFPDNPARQARRKLKEQAKVFSALSRASGENRGWQIQPCDGIRVDEETWIGGIPVWKFIKGGKFQPVGQVK